MDGRDQRTWIAVELSKIGESQVDSPIFQQFIRDELLKAPSEHPVFVPVFTHTRANRTVTYRLMEGYVFVASGLPEVAYFRMENHPYVESVVSVTDERKMRVLATIPDRQIEDLKAKLRGMTNADIEVGSRVRVDEGVYSGIEAVVEDSWDDYVVVSVSLRSLRLVTSVPKVSVEVVDPPATCSNEEEMAKVDEGVYHLGPVYTSCLLNEPSKVHGGSVLSRLNNARKSWIQAVEMLDGESNEEDQE